jgi:hypothetical protein
MALQTVTNFDMSKNTILADGLTLTYDTMTNVATPPATQASVVAGTGTPTFSAKKGTLYINLTGSSVSTRLYVNTDGATTWTSFTSAA